MSNDAQLSKYLRRRGEARLFICWSCLSLSQHFLFSHIFSLPSSSPSSPPDYLLICPLSPSLSLSLNLFFSPCGPSQLHTVCPPVFNKTLLSSFHTFPSFFSLFSSPPPLLYRCFRPLWTPLSSLLSSLLCLFSFLINFFCNLEPTLPPTCLVHSHTRPAVLTHTNSPKRAWKWRLNMLFTYQLQAATESMINASQDQHRSC